MEIYKQGLLEPAKLCTIGKARKARIAQGHLKAECEGTEVSVYILCLNFYFSFLSWSKSEAPQMPQCIHEWKKNEANYAYKSVSSTRMQVSTDGQGCCATLSITSASP